ncbi:MAG: efflux RND transporter periplasmic adaptor subunit [Bacteroidetes bacterium]|nr:efflux RND transporter periplasmic adaptor subunit [Bacteroidota bacterium]
MKKPLFITIIAILLLGTTTGYYFYAQNDAEEVQFRSEKVSRGDMQVVVTATGTLSAVRTVQVGSQVSGTLQKVNVDFNDKVSKGQIVAQIDPTFLEASVRDAEASLQRTTAQYNEAKRSYERIRTLVEKNLASQADYDAAMAQFEANDAARKQSVAQVERAKINLRYATIKSPIDGVVISRAVDVGQTVAASLSAPTLFTIAHDLTKMQVQANVDEADIGKVEEQQEVTFTVDAYPEQAFRGKVRQVRLSPKVEQNVVNYTVIIDVPNPDLKLMPGMTATVTILINRKEAVLRVPTVALRFNPPEEYIEIRKDSAQQGGGSDTAQNDRRRQWRERMQREGGGPGGGPGGGIGGGMGGGGFDPQRRMQQRIPSRIWVMNERKKLEPVMVRTGISDGTFTEIVRGRIEEGQEIVVGTIAQKPVAVQNSSPFNQQRNTGGGMPRRF